LKRIYYAPDGGGGGAGSQNAGTPASELDSQSAGTQGAEGEQGQAGSQGESQQAPSAENDDPYKGTWLSQLSKETRDKHRDQLEGIKGKHIGEVLDEYFTNRETLDKRAIVFPGKDAKPEEVDEFLKKMDIPKKLEGYGFDPKGIPADPDGSFTKYLGEQCLKSALTRKQGKQMYQCLADFAQATLNMNESQKKESAASFEKRLAEEHSGDEKATKETQEWYKRFMVSAGKGVAKDLMDSGLAYNTKFAKHIAAVQKAAMAEPPLPHGGHAGRDQGKSGFNYDSQVMEKYRR
jgi:hypothetical protein